MAEAGPTFEKIEERHIPEVLEIEKESNSAPWSERSFRHEITHEHSVFLVALHAGRVVGYAGVWLVVDEAHVTTVAVAPKHRGKGLGRQLTIEVLSRARDRGMLCSTLEVRAGNVAAIRLYEALGFVSTAVRKRYYPDNQEDAVVMWLHDLQGWTPTA